MDGLLWFPLVGLVAGWLAGVLVNVDGHGAIGDIVIDVKPLLHSRTT